MINTKLFKVEKLVKRLLEDSDHVMWREQCTIEAIDTGEEGYNNIRFQIRYDRPDGKYPIFLRHSKGPRQGYFWDVYGDDFHDFELALLALHHAPMPIGFAFNGTSSKPE